MKSERQEFAARLFPRHPPTPSQLFPTPASRSNWDVSELSLLSFRDSPALLLEPTPEAVFSQQDPGVGRLPTPRGPAGEPRPQSGGVVSAAALQLLGLTPPSPSRGS